MTISTSTTARPAELPDSIVLSPVVPVTEISDPDGHVEAGDFVFGITVAGKKTYSTTPISPAMRMVNVGTRWLMEDGVTEFDFDGVWIVRAVEDGMAHLTFSPSAGVCCSVYDWCTGHDVGLLADPGDPDDARGDYRLITQHWAKERDFFDFGTTEFGDDRDGVTIGPMDHEGAAMMNVQVKFDRALTADGVEEFAAQLEALAAKLRVEAPDVLAGVLS